MLLRRCVQARLYLGGMIQLCSGQGLGCLLLKVRWAAALSRLLT